MNKPLICITGANGQIGSYLAKTYMAEAYPLLLIYHSRKERISDLLDQTYSLQLDLMDGKTLSQELSGLCQSQNIRIGALIHTAAVRSYDALPLAETDPDIFRSVFDANFYSAYNVLKAVLPYMQDAGWGRVVMFGSDVSSKGLAQGSAYAAAKAAIANLVKSAAREYAPCGILINTVSPAPVETELEEDYKDEYLEFRKRYFAHFIESSATGKLVSTAELKAVVDLLINPEVNNLCGEEIFLRGGIL
ncbi:MAG TPA: SDR family oxidoreductase [Candidatus Cloacimonadota bacterium]|nr:SDR family oxidoreductase [Candidatus Cloacimonadota bacterium]